MAHNAYLTAANPNDIHGGGGDIAGPITDTDSFGPWVVWPAQEFEAGCSPVACVSFGAFLTMKKLFEEAEVLAVERADVPASATSAPKPEQGESPEFDLEDPEQRRAFIAAVG